MVRWHAHVPNIAPAHVAMVAMVAYSPIKRYLMQNVGLSPNKPVSATRANTHREPLRGLS